jgi:hypothetical protein
VSKLEKSKICAPGRKRIFREKVLLLAQNKQDEFDFYKKKLFQADQWL